MKTSKNLKKRLLALNAKKLLSTELIQIKGGVRPGKEHSIGSDDCASCKSTCQTGT